MRIDLHTHSAESDGTQSPTELVRTAAAVGIDVIALTDHDTTDGWAQAVLAARTYGIALVRGSELSTSLDGVRVHLLSYLHDPQHRELADTMAATRAHSANRARVIVERLAQEYPVHWADVVAHASSASSVGRPHIADALVKEGHFQDRAAVFATVFAPGSRYLPSRHAPDTREAVRLVRAAGGVPVLAHPGAQARGPILSDEAIAVLAAEGLAGLEIDHRDNPPAQRERLHALARDLCLSVTGSSDYHGRGKPNLLGEHTTAPHVLADIAAQGYLEVI